MTEDDENPECTHDETVILEAHNALTAAGVPRTWGECDGPCREANLELTLVTRIKRLAKNRDQIADKLVETDTLDKAPAIAAQLAHHAPGTDVGATQIEALEAMLARRTEEFEIAARDAIVVRQLAAQEIARLTAVRADRDAQIEALEIDVAMLELHIEDLGEFGDLNWPWMDDVWEGWTWTDVRDYGRGTETEEES